MSLNRDLAILFTISHFPKDRLLQLCDPMAGSGVRAVRYALEAPNVASVVAADRLPDAAELARETVRLNNVEDKVFVIEADALHYSLRIHVRGSTLSTWTRSVLRPHSSNALYEQPRRAES